jgi:hypothetical protein
MLELRCWAHALAGGARGGDPGVKALYEKAVEVEVYSAIMIDFLGTEVPRLYREVY